MKTPMAFTVLLLAFPSVGCDRLSEKDKMEMIAKCDSEARKKFSEKFESDSAGYSSIEVETHYSFDEKFCYALVKEQFSVLSQSTTFTEALYNGLTKKQLLMATCRMERDGEDECSSGGGFVLGDLKEEGNKNEKGLVSYREGIKIIEGRMNRP
jgi:hypothetical protein